MNIIYLVNRHYVQTKMSRIRFHSIEALSKICNVTVTGIDFPGYNNKLSVQENIKTFEILNKKKYHCVIAYKPLEFVDFSKLKLTKILRYNEMYDKDETIKEIENSLPDIVITHHQNDYEFYNDLYKDKNILFYHIPHCINKNVFKDYKIEKIYDITFSGALGNSILGNHYPMRQKLLEVSKLFVKKYPQYNLFIHRHPGYTLHDAYTNKYCIELSQIYNKSHICITCSGAPNTRFAKYVEIPGSNSVIIGDIPREKNDIEDFKKFIIDVKLEDTNESIMNKLLYYLENKDKLLEKQEYGYKWSQKYTQKYYATQLKSFIVKQLNLKFNNTIQCMWIGDPLGKIEKASLKSFVKNGHIVHLYLYENFTQDGIPEGVIIKDANEILNKSEIFTYENGSYAAFSNLFRFKLLYMKGGYWCDLDLINLKMLDFEEEYTFVSEPTPDYLSQVPTTCMIKMPLGCEAAKKAIEICYTLKEDVLNNKLKWGLGPMVLKIIIDGLKLQKYVKHWSTVCSNHPNDTLSLFFNDYKNPRGLGKIINRKRDIPENMYCVHLWNKVIRENNLLELNKKDSFINYLLNI